MLQFRMLQDVLQDAVPDGATGLLYEQQIAGADYDKCQPSMAIYKGILMGACGALIRDTGRVVYFNEEGDDCPYTAENESIPEWAARLKSIVRQDPSKYILPQPDTSSTVSAGDGYVVADIRFYNEAIENWDISSYLDDEEQESWFGHLCVLVVQMHAEGGPPADVFLFEP